MKLGMCLRLVVWCRCVNFFGHKSHGAAPFYYRTEFTTLPRYCEEAWFLFKHRCTCFAICKPGKSVSRAARLLFSSPNVCGVGCTVDDRAAIVRFLFDFALVGMGVLGIIVEPIMLSGDQGSYWFGRHWSCGIQSSWFLILGALKYTA